MTMESPREDFPSFYADAPSITLRDPLAQFLGAAREGLMHYHYVDAVRLAGHSCPTVAGTWLMTLHALRALYDDELPVRGEIEVYMADARDAGATGVMASVAQLVTGAAPETGFHGIGGRFGRNELLRYEQPVPGAMGFRRRDTGMAVQVELNASVVPWPSEMRGLIPLAVGGQASPEQLQRFGALWQDRVRKMLVEHAEDLAMVQVAPWTT
ncbi:MAG TPA: hypothetical protein PKA16_04430 [Ottowia sp.]|uniref:hypothetical protein n=1 Tax=Ottowia sp. TaxID=1898956 RepID=UPI002CD1873E|nr:hypothetical protein [Ottowia sp.]HMN20622.1 hypothetical protein [Ottowia sp.]